MLEFSANDPFPMIDFERTPYREILRHSQAVDRWLGFDYDAIEKALTENGCRTRPSRASSQYQQLWFGLAVQSLLTPYVEFRAILGQLRVRPGNHVVDLGAGYGRLAFVIDRHHPGVRFTGYEYVGERVREAQRVLKNRRLARETHSILHADLTAPDFLPQPADFYFIYDYGTPKAVEKTLYDLRRMGESWPSVERDFALIARGRHCRMLIESRHPWLVPALPGTGESRVTIYRRAGFESAICEGAAMPLTTL